MVWCTSCGTELAQQYTFCYICGTRAPSEQTPVPSAGNLQLSAEALESFRKIKERYGGEIKGEKRKKADPKSENVVIGVTVLDKNMRPVMKGFSVGTGLFTVIKINVSRTSTSIEWIKETEKYFSTDMDFVGLDATPTGFSKVKEPLKLGDLDFQRKERRAKDYRFYVMANKDKKEIKRSFKGKSGENKTPTEKEDVQRYLLKRQRKTSETVTEANPEDVKASTSECIVIEDPQLVAVPEKDLGLDILMRKQDEKAEHEMVDDADNINTEHEAPLELEDDEDNSTKELQVPLERAESEMTEYYAMMSRKEKRQMAAIERKKDSDKMIQKTVVYSAHGGIAYSFRIPTDANVQELYDYVCALVPYEILPARFVLCSTAMEEFSLLDKRIMSDLPMAVLIKEENLEDLNETLTNYDEVFI